MINNSESSFDLRVADGEGQTLLFALPKLKFASGLPNVPGKNADVVLDLAFQAYRDPTLGYTMLCQRFYNVA